MSEFKKCYNYSINLLSKRDYSKYKLTQKLKLRGHTPEEIEHTINKLIEQNYLREQEYKRIRIRQLLNKGYAPNFIIQKCEQEHLQVDPSDIDNIKTSYQISDEEQIDKLIQKKIRYTDLPQEYEKKQKIKNRVYRFLLSKGYRYDQFKEAVEKYF